MVPAPLSDAPWEDWLAPRVRERILSLDYFIAENARSARAALKGLGVSRPVREVEIRELPRGKASEPAHGLLAPVLKGRSAGLISEAGMPAVADPGADVVRAAHLANINVVPLTGPSSLLLALTASGMCGQRFCFHGYLPAKPDQRARRILELERDSHSEARTHIFIEAPYRNNAVLATILDTCQTGTWLTVARDLTARSEFVLTRQVADWRSQPRPALDRHPTVFLLAAS